MGVRGRKPLEIKLRTCTKCGEEFEVPRLETIGAGHKTPYFSRVNSCNKCTGIIVHGQLQHIQAMHPRNVLRLLYILSNPCLTQSAYANVFGLTRERVRQICNRGEELYGINIPVRPFPLLRTCPHCSTEFYGAGKKQRFCSRECFSDSRRIEIACDECGELFKRRAAEVIEYIGKRGYQHCFCNNKCQGKWMGRNYGFTAHPENAGIGIRKWNYEEVWKLRDRGATHREIHNNLGIPYGTITSIIRREKKANVCQ